MTELELLQELCATQKKYIVSLENILDFHNIGYGDGAASYVKKQFNQEALDLIGELGNVSGKELAEKLGVVPSLISMWKKRGIPEDKKQEILKLRDNQQARGNTNEQT